MRPGRAARPLPSDVTPFVLPKLRFARTTGHGTDA